MGGTGRSWVRLCGALGIIASFACHASGAIVSKNLGDIWFIGDSITQSNSDGDANGSPRKSLFDKLTAGGYTFGYTGHTTLNTDGLTGAAYTSHSGISGSTIGANTGGRQDMTAGIPGWWTTGLLLTNKPNVILIMLGTNDINSNINIATAPSRMTTLVDTIFAQSGIGNPTVMIATIPPNRISTTTQTNVAAFNAALPGIVSGLRGTGKDVYLIDQFTPINDLYATAMRPDNLHPNALGNDLIGQTWFNAIQAMAVPEPSAFVLPIVLGATCLVVRLRRR
ncbi:MAG: SGNH/GDSL hydrolase family protein [Pirellulales bacterium]